MKNWESSERVSVVSGSGVTLQIQKKLAENTSCVLICILFSAWNKTQLILSKTHPFLTLGCT